VHTELSERIAHALQRAAMKRSRLSYQKFHLLCGADARLWQRYDALEAAISALGDLKTVDYGVLLALDSGLPGPDFFQRFCKHRHSEYVAIVGDPKFQRQSVSRKRILVEMERERVYEHARSAAPLVGERAGM
jgi:hypothetical protein